MKKNNVFNLSLALTLLFSIPALAHSQDNLLLDCHSPHTHTSYTFRGDILGLSTRAPTNGFVEVTNGSRSQSIQPVQYVYRGWTVHQARFLLDGNKFVAYFSDLDTAREYAPKTGTELLFSDVTINEDPQQSVHEQTKPINCRFKQTEKP